MEKQLLKCERRKSHTVRFRLQRGWWLVFQTLQAFLHVPCHKAFLHYYWYGNEYYSSMKSRFHTAWFSSLLFIILRIFYLINDFRMAIISSLAHRLTTHTIYYIIMRSYFNTDGNYDETKSKIYISVKNNSTFLYQCTIKNSIVLKATFLKLSFYDNYTFWGPLNAKIGFLTVGLLSA